MKDHPRKWYSSSVRDKAEAWMTTDQNKAFDLTGLSGKEIKALIHELRVHQIELEMQNTELRRTQLELQAARDEYADLYDFSPVGYCTTSADGVILKANKTLSTLLGVEKSELMGEPLSRFVSKEAQDIFYFHRKNLLESNGDRTCELVMVKADGSRFDAQLDSIPVADTLGDLTQTRTAVSDISERKKLEQALRESETQLRHTHKMTAIGIMAGGIAHDFNNLLMVILGNIELAEDRGQKSCNIASHLDAARRAASRAAGIVKQILHVSRQKDTPGTPVRITAVVDASLKRFSALLPPGIEIKREFSADIDTVVANETQIHRVLMNLCDNAVEAIGKSGGQITIGLTNEVIGKNAAFSPRHLLPGCYLKLSVKDTGNGIDPRILDQIFTPYFTTKGVGKGTGFGLAVVYGILLNHNGRIFVSSEVGKGTTFDLYLPIVESDGGLVST
ncbi:MAG: ATP-binding protein [Pseudomonadota bacterium]